MNDITKIHSPYILYLSKVCLTLKLIFLRNLYTPAKLCDQIDSNTEIGLSHSTHIFMG